MQTHTHLFIIVHAYIKCHKTICCGHFQCGGMLEVLYGDTIVNSNLFVTITNKFSETNVKGLFEKL